MSASFKIVLSNASTLTPISAFFKIVASNASTLTPISPSVKTPVTNEPVLDQAVPLETHKSPVSAVTHASPLGCGCGGSKL